MERKLKGEIEFLIRRLNDVELRLREKEKVNEKYLTEVLNVLCVDIRKIKYFRRSYLILGPENII